MRRLPSYRPNCNYPLVVTLPDGSRNLEHYALPHRKLMQLAEHRRDMIASYRISPWPPFACEKMPYSAPHCRCCHLQIQWHNPRAISHLFTHDDSRNRRFTVMLSTSKRGYKQRYKIRYKHHYKQ